MASASFSYGARGAMLLRGMSLRLRPGSLTAVTGAVGSGKSNLMAAILGHMTCTAGSCAAAGSFSFVPQTPWCAHGTVRDNITFGAPWDEAASSLPARSSATWASWPTATSRRSASAA